MLLKDLSNRLVTLELTPSEDWPDDARETVLAALRSGDPLTTERAAHLAWPLIDEDMTTELLAIVRSDAAPEIRGSAAIAFGPTLEDEHLDRLAAEGAGSAASETASALAVRIQAALREAFEDTSQPKLVRRRALEASVRGPLDWHPDAIRGIADSEDEDWRLTALFCMGNSEGFDEQVLDALQAASGDMLVTAVRAAEDLVLEDAGPRLLELAAGDTPMDVRSAAIYALGTIRPDGAQELLEALAVADDPEVASLADAVLAEMEDDDWEDEDDEDDED